MRLRTQVHPPSNVVRKRTYYCAPSDGVKCSEIDFYKAGAGAKPARRATVFKWK